MDNFEMKCKAELEKEVEIYLDFMENKKQPPEAMFDYLYETLPEKFHAQREEVIRRAK
jgi:TPP-dependent pyruvate/acetoin dehydrogenase alpha subunit